MLLKFCNHIKGERLLDGIYGLREGYAAYEYWKQDCLDFFAELRGVWNCGRAVVSEIDALLR